MFLYHSHSIENVKKAIIIGIIVIVIIGIGFAMSQGNESETQQVVVIEEDEGEPKRYTVGLSESMGVSEIPP